MVSVGFLLKRLAHEHDISILDKTHGAPHYNLYGFPWAFAAWAFEAIPSLAQMATNNCKMTLPRMMRWIPYESLVHDSNPFNTCASKKHEKVHPFLVPTNTEKKKYMQKLEPFAEEVADEKIDMLKEELQGVTTVTADSRAVVNSPVSSSRGLEKNITKELVEANNQSVKVTMEDEKKNEDQDVVRLIKEKDSHSQEIAALKQELEIARDGQQKLEERLKEVESLFKESTSRVKESTELHLGLLRELKFGSQSIKQEIVKTQRSYTEEFSQLGAKLKSLEDAVANSSIILAENRKLYNEVQDLKGNIRVYCRVRPFLRGQKDKQTVVEYVGENGELTV